MTAVDFVMAITNALNRHGELCNPPNKYITHLCYLENSQIVVEGDKINRMGIEVVMVRSKEPIEDRLRPVYDDRDLIVKILSLIEEDKNENRSEELTHS
jgi:hypothetical protein